MLTLSASEARSRTSNGTSLEKLIGDLEELCSRGREGDRLPTRAQLMETYSASERTVLRALDVLERSERIVRRQGWGVFIARQPEPNSVPKDNGYAPTVERSFSAPIISPVRSGVIGMTAFLDESKMGTDQDLPATLATLRAIEGQSRTLGLKTNFLNRWRAKAPEISPATAARELLAQGVDGVIVVDLYTHPYVLSELGGMREIADLPLVYVSNVDHYVPCAHVSFDNRDAGYRAAELLLACGHESITFLSPYEGRWVNLRVEGARIAAERAKSPTAFRVFPSEGYVEVNDASAEELVTKTIERMLREGEVHGGIVAAHDRVARILMAEAAKHGLIAGQDFGIVGFDDDPRSFTQGLSTMRPPFGAMGIEAARVVAACLAEGTWNRTVNLRAEVVARTTHTSAARTLETV